jgi:hypothetical protein
MPPKLPKENLKEWGAMPSKPPNLKKIINLTENLKENLKEEY